jgi:hypothetical protein
MKTMTPSRMTPEIDRTIDSSSDGAWDRGLGARHVVPVRRLGVEIENGWHVHP